ncbi:MULTISPECIES: 16S rRNA (cytosine(1402)-N(4))-methyltransferase RsmH [Salegentibacter]|jgi:16S rRNA (cytosine1402-N4)-methyltransferase|uniref:Ribosomal RNA small subunit methyltransferase H n=1 Tax=Salegentibacter agarivorans TaxID=345907 RepID=A0A1I2LLG8_9FLAO|nr:MULTISPECIES: 16S rRNA (cytosine(1402)-N(4))-methyltransferase RsmH [Salegentibacter]APS37632.1 ribosomal RNA small subunit methyltransferase H [Salegentibacter sp. T436]SFF79963.1 16S rRNA (cytosine1402-N4)-methyltransferase [Salegentibacter agarivorans]|tara:strand:+ start:3885 stop:4781 length:897 start_codon:yes stop_codon:yes gene_type:complete
MQYHNPVLLKESVDGLNIKEDGVYVDVTFGGGGHSREILNRLGPKGKLFAFDQDKDALENKIEDPRFILIHENFRFIKRFLRFYGIKKVDGILGDFGVSSHQFNEAERGFSTRFDARLDMRMNQGSNLSAFEVINEYTEEQLKKLFYDYADLKNAPKLANLIVEARKEKAIESSEQLNDLLKPHLFKGKENKILAQIYQAIRIEVNQEIEALKEFLKQTEELVVKNGRISLISYHSLEDRLVKRYIRSGLFEGEPEKDFYGNISVPFKKVGGLIVPSAEEIKENNRARSAKLRVAKKL